MYIFAWEIAKFKYDLQMLGLIKCVHYSYYMPSKLCLLSLVNGSIRPGKLCFLCPGKLGLSGLVNSAHWPWQTASIRPGKLCCYVRVNCVYQAW